MDSFTKEEVINMTKGITNVQNILDDIEIKDGDVLEKGQNLKTNKQAAIKAILEYSKNLQRLFTSP